MLKYENLTQRQVQALAEQLAKQLKNKAATIGLMGELGAGKTTFVKAFAKALGIRRTSSPTFVVTHEHPFKYGKLYHIDFYRLENPKQLKPLGLDEIIAGKNLILIEWIDRFPQIQRRCDLLINFIVKGTKQRNVIIQTPTKK